MTWQILDVCMGLCNVTKDAMCMVIRPYTKTNDVINLYKVQSGVSCLSAISPGSDIMPDKSVCLYNKGFVSSILFLISHEDIVSSLS